MAWKLRSSIEEAVAEIAEAFEATYEEPQDQLKALLRVAQAFSPTGEDAVGRAFIGYALEFGMKHNLCHQCAAKLVEFEDEWFCPSCDAGLLAMRQEQAIRRAREAV